MLAQTEDKTARTARYVARGHLRSITGDRRVEACGFGMLGSGVELRHREGVASIAGLETCGRVWLCPVCNSKVMARRALEVGAALTWASSADVSMLWGAFTVQHDASTPLAGMLGIQRAAWRRVVSSRVWRDLNATVTVDHQHVETCDWSCDRRRDVIASGESGRVGYLRAAELTVGLNGWHPHFHPLLMFQGLSSSELEAHAAELRSLWAFEVRAAGGRADDNDAQHLRVVEPGQAVQQLGSYLVKATYDGSVSPLEVVWSQGKARSGRVAKTRAHWALLHDGVQGASVGAKWRELEKSIGQHRALVWSRGLRVMAGVGVELDDETVAAETLGGPEDSVCFISRRGWYSLRNHPDRVAQLLAVQESAGWFAARQLLDSWAVEYFFTASDYLADAA